MRSTTPESGRADPEGVLGGARRVVRRHVQGVEVEPLGLDLGALGPLVAHREEQVGDPLGQRGQRVPGAGGDPVPRQRDVDRLLDQDPLVALGLELGLPGGQRLGDRTAGGADPLARLGLGGRRQRADLPVGQRQRRPVAGVLEPDRLERVEVGGGGDRGERGVAGGSTSSAFKGVTCTGSKDLFGADMGETAPGGGGVADRSLRRPPAGQQPSIRPAPSVLCPSRPERPDAADAGDRSCARTSHRARPRRRRTEALLGSSPPTPTRAGACCATTSCSSRTAACCSPTAGGSSRSSPSRAAAAVSSAA